MKALSEVVCSGFWLRQYLRRSEKLNKVVLPNGLKHN